MILSLDLLNEMKKTTKYFDPITNLMKFHLDNTKSPESVIINTFLLVRSHISVRTMCTQYSSGLKQLLIYIYAPFHIETVQLTLDIIKFE